MEVKDKTEKIAMDAKNPETEDNQNSKTQADKNGKRKSSSATIKKLRQQVETAQKERDELKELLLRKAAEFENYKKRTGNESLQIIANANADLISELLPVYDDLERSVAAAKEKEDFGGLFSGVELILKNFVKVLESRGLQQIGAVGQPFDPEKHDALMQVESDKHPSGTVVDEHLKGYELNGRVLRHSQVLVSK